MNTTGIYWQEKLSLSSSRSDMWQIWGLQAVSLSSKVFKFVQSPICDLFFPIAIITPNLALAPQMRWCKNFASNPLRRKSFLLLNHILSSGWLSLTLIPPHPYLLPFSKLCRSLYYWAQLPHCYTQLISAMYCIIVQLLLYFCLICYIVLYTEWILGWFDRHQIYYFKQIKVPVTKTNMY